MGGCFSASVSILLFGIRQGAKLFGPLLDRNLVDEARPVFENRHFGCTDSLILCFMSSTKLSMCRACGIPAPREA